MNKSNNYSVLEYDDTIHAEVLEGLEHGDYGYKYRRLDGVVMPPYVTPSRYQLARSISTRQGDICYTSYPKSGSTWLAYVLYMIVNNGDVPSSNTLRNSLQWVESSWTYPRSKAELEAMSGPRIFKSHMPYDMALSGDPSQSEAKFIYIARNPKDVVVSYYYFERQKSWSGYYNGPWEHWLEMFLNGKVQRGDWFHHVLSWWEKRHAENILFVKYEDLLGGFDAEVTRIADFLGYPLNTTVRNKIREETSFKNMKSTPFSSMGEIKEFNQFFRKGRVGSWGEQFTEQQEKAFDAIYRDRMQGTGLDFEFE